MKHVILALATLALSAAPAVAEAAQPCSPKSPCVTNKAKLSMDVKNVALAQILSLLAKKGGFSYVLDRGVNPGAPVTVHLSAVSIGDAFDAILTSQGLSCSKKGAVVMISREVE